MIGEMRTEHINLMTRKEWLIMNIYPAAIDHVTRYGEIYAAAFSGEPWNDPWRPEDAEIHVRELLTGR